MFVDFINKKCTPKIILFLLCAISIIDVLWFLYFIDYRGALYYLINLAMLLLVVFSLICRTVITKKHFACSVRIVCSIIHIIIYCYLYAKITPDGTINFAISLISIPLLIPFIIDVSFNAL